MPDDVILTSVDIDNAAQARKAQQMMSTTFTDKEEKKAKDSIPWP